MLSRRRSASAVPEAQTRRQRPTEDDDDDEHSHRLPRRLSHAVCAASRVLSGTYSDAPTHISGVSARIYLIRQRKNSPRRVIPDTADLPLRLLPIRAGGDCGFEAIATALPAPYTGADIRKITQAHVSNESTQYTRACGGTSSEVASFCRSITRPGLRGHWLGQMWGALEIVAVARALSVTIRIHAFDVRTQRFRPYFEECAGDHLVRLLFTGTAERGHFDALVDASPPQWRRRLAKHLAAVAAAVR